MYGGVDVLIHNFLTSTLAGGDLSASHPARFTPGEKAPGTRYVWRCVGTRAGLDDLEKFVTLPELELRPLGSPARSQSLYRLSYPGSCRDEVEEGNLWNFSFKLKIDMADHQSRV
jgi:hypothetical protein